MKNLIREVRRSFRRVRVLGRVEKKLGRSLTTRERYLMLWEDEVLRELHLVSGMQMYSPEHRSRALKILSSGLSRLAVPSDILMEPQEAAQVLVERLPVVLN